MVPLTFTTVEENNVCARCACSTCKHRTIASECPADNICGLCTGKLQGTHGIFDPKYQYHKPGKCKHYEKEV